MTILLVAGGKPETWPDLKQYDIYIGIDRGALYILAAGYPLTLAIGDFDSLSQEEFDQVSSQAKTIIQAPPEKDDTDTQLALAETLRRYPEATIDLIGVTGGRLDHLLANLWLVLEPRFQPFAGNIRLLDHQNSISFYLPGSYRIRHEAGMKYLAYCCLTPVVNLTLEGSKYLLNNMDVSQPTSYASNEFITETASFSFDAGVIAVIQSRD
ncbi:thiamine pyrophosphokinase [Enterococcus sp. 8G7_MSG3316]|uniref:Thiamine diphosphokinase n=1 Tax=Candidatus Enterococcus testudinis TaxID=1834191 RepID=A0A242AAD0_9ENTE|nr:thiamine diphosphokinase [Enterococcus sp. 8G7_MSG3316]OTN77996.1 thiamine pyrophosphokinase [Enterococcus sp. 8G7_MSG3316]